MFSVSLSVLRTFLLSKRRGVLIGKGSRVYYRSPVYYDVSSEDQVRKTRIIIGCNCRIGTSPINYHAGIPFPTTLFCDNHGTITIGDNSRINGAYIHAQEKITIGKNCVIASGVNIIDSNGHVTNSNNRTIGRDTPKEIIIGDNVWIGINSTVLKGSVIGSNSIISAGSVVHGTVPNNTIYSTQQCIETKELIKS